MSAPSPHRRLTHAIALALGAVLLSGAGNFDRQVVSAGPSAAELREEQGALAAPRESTAAVRDAPGTPAAERVRLQPVGARGLSRPAGVNLVVSTLALRAPAVGSGQFGQRPLSSACPPQGPPA